MHLLSSCRGIFSLCSSQTFLTHATADYTDMHMRADITGMMHANLPLFFQLIGSPRWGSRGLTAS